MTGASADASAHASRPFGAVGAGKAAVCRCGAGRHAEREDRCAAGHVWPGTPGPALVAGQHSFLFSEAEAHARNAIEAAVVRDAGHTPNDAPEALRLAAGSIAQAALLQQSAFARLVESGGPLTTRGRARRAYAVWLTATDRLERGVRLVGLRRVPRPAPSLASVLAEAEERR